MECDIIEYKNCKGKKVYGGVFAARMDAIKNLHGQDALIAFFKKLRRIGYEGPDNDSLKLKEMYEMKDFMLILDTYFKMYGENDFQRMSKIASKKKGIVGVFIRWAATPEMIASKAPMYWKQFYNFGELSAAVEKNKITVTGKDTYVSPLLCEAITWYYQGVIESTGLKVIAGKHTKCVGKGDDVCEWEITWDG